MMWASAGGMSRNWMNCLRVAGRATTPTRSWEDSAFGPTHRTGKPLCFRSSPLKREKRDARGTAMVYGSHRRLSLPTLPGWWSRSPKGSKQAPTVSTTGTLRKRWEAMDSTFITAAAAAMGSLVGAVATVGATWITQRTQSARAKIEAKVRDRESLYGEFITEASRLTVEALTHSLEQPETLVKLYGVLGRIRLVAGETVLASAEACCRLVIDLYAKPNLTAEQI